MKKVLLAVSAAVMLLSVAGCSSTPNTMKLQQGTTNLLGLASTDEVTLSNIQKGTPNALGGSDVTFDATTAKGRKFKCKTFMIPGLLAEPTYSDFTCGQ
ncbi:hypothetical protein NG99_10175 [Erwinia typographi]|uniref:Lipoprotein n=1 Tax=Erwinia typographi TaxID=371042 RepID=A0A0A3Z550_9GAMM|nr:hypothetical protein [Erwinia typographi]KGT94207.1 hypothetical protein NG99_10175 [Erwinia typographi]